MSKSAPKVDVRNKLKLKHLEEIRRLGERHPHAKDFLDRKGLSLSKIREHSARAIAAGALAGSLAFSPPVHAKAPSLPPPLVATLIAAGAAVPENPEEYLADELNNILPEKPHPLDLETEKNVGLLIERLSGIKARGTLEGEHLNTTYGYIGYEQHLQRYPGDTIGQHDEFQEAGIAPGRGAWGYFAYSKSQMTPDLYQKEKYYAVVQTMYLLDWEKRHKYLVEWYKYRKVIILNTQNGRAVVAAIADAGPAAWTGKHFGASPEAMNAIGGSKYRKGPVIMFFVDDPNNEIPLGPVEYNKIDRPTIAEQT